MFCPDEAGHLSCRRMLSDLSLLLAKVVLRQVWSPEKPASPLRYASPEVIAGGFLRVSGKRQPNDR
jgi:hypothetical protein